MIFIASSPNPCKSNPCLFKIIVDIVLKEIHEDKGKVLDVYNFIYGKLISKLASKSSLDSYKCNLPCDKFLFKCPKCELIYKFIPM